MSYHEQLENALLFSHTTGKRLLDEQFVRDLLAEYRALYQHRGCEDCGWEDYVRVTNFEVCPSCDSIHVEVLP